MSLNLELARQKILIVDDEPINIKTLNEMLHQQYQVIFATSGSKALELAALSMPDLVLLDIKMPDMDGYQVCRALKEDPLLREIPVVFITSLTAEIDEASGLALGAVDYITKPFNPAIVMLRVRNHLELKRQRDLLSRLSLLDSLTGLPNRRAFDERLDLEWRRMSRLHNPIAIVMIDIDHFKRYNDSVGHLAGDGCLREVAHTLATNLGRAGDFLARYGGEEFVCILPGLSGPNLAELAEKIRLSVEARQIDFPPSDCGPFVTVSLGAACCLPTPLIHPQSLIEAADRLLYQAKTEGRNRCCIQQTPHSLNP